MRFWVEVGLRCSQSSWTGDTDTLNETKDSNSNYLATYCFNLGIALKRVEVIPDDEEDIIATVRKHSKDYDFVVTSGGKSIFYGCEDLAVGVELSKDD